MAAPASALALEVGFGDATKFGLAGTGVKVVDGDPLAFLVFMFRNVWAVARRSQPGPHIVTGWGRLRAQRTSVQITSRADPTPILA